MLLNKYDDFEKPVIISPKQHHCCYYPFLAVSTGKVFTRENTRWCYDAAFMTEFNQRNIIHAPWNITPKAPNIITPPFVSEVIDDHEAREKEKVIINQSQEKARTRALADFDDYIPRPTGGFTL